MFIYSFLILMTTFTDPSFVIDFNKDTNTSQWQIIDDVVMGGRSDGNFKITVEGHGMFYGAVSLENNGGFSSVRKQTSIEGVPSDGKVRIRLKGDGKSYQFRVKQDARAYYSYIYPFETSGEWETIEISLKDMYPSWRGRKLSGPNFDHTSIEEITFLIGNKKSQSFELLLDKIEIID